jgi:flagellar motor switch protein FliG
MRSPIGPVLVILGIATAAVLVLVLLQSMSLREELRQARDEVGALQARVDTLETVAPDDLRRELEELESGIRDWLIATGADGGFETDPGQPAGGSATADEILDRIDDVLARITALDRRVDDICAGVPVC